MRAMGTFLGAGRTGPHHRKDLKERLTFGLVQFKDILDIDKGACPRRLAEHIDPRDKAGLFPPPGVSIQDMEHRLITKWIPRNDNNPCTKGHYLIFYGYFLSKESANGEMSEILVQPILGEVPMVEESIFDKVESKGKGGEQVSYRF